MERTDRDIDDFLETLDEEVRDDMRTLHQVIGGELQGLPVALYEGVFWGGSHQEIIGYGTYSYTKSDKTEVEWFLVGLARQKRYLSVYVNAVEDRKYLSEVYGPDLGKVKVGKASIGFDSVADIDLDRLRALVARAREIHESD